MKADTRHWFEKNIKLSMRPVSLFLMLVSLIFPSIFLSTLSQASASGPTLNLPEAQTFATTNSWFDVVPASTTDVLSGFSGNVRAVLGVDNGALRIKSGTVTTTTASNDGLSLSGGITVSQPFGYRSALIGDTGTGAAEVAFEGSISNVNAVLKNLQFNRSGAGGSTLSVSVVKAGASGTVAYDPNSQRYYEFINSSMTWVNARCHAKFIDGAYNASSTRFDKCDESKLTPRTFNGLKGYLATVTSSEENTFVTSRAGTSQAWIGGSDSVYTRLADAQDNVSSNIDFADQVWRWVDGPEAGLVFWISSCNTGLQAFCTQAGVSTDANYNFWNTGEPNGTGGGPLNGGGEGALQLLSGGTGKWNDLPINSSSLPLIVEYGGLSEETAEEQLQSSVALNVAQNGPPTAITASSGDARATVSWTASTIVTGALTGYTVTANPGGATCTTTSTSCVVTGLLNGTSYTFTVTAEFSGGSPSRTSVLSNSVTPALAPAPAPASGPGASSPTPTATPSPTTTRSPRPARTITPEPTTSPTTQALSPQLTPGATPTSTQRPQAGSPSRPADLVRSNIDEITEVLRPRVINLNTLINPTNNPDPVASANASNSVSQLPSAAALALVNVPEEQKRITDVPSSVLKDGVPQESRVIVIQETKSQVVTPDGGLLTVESITEQEAVPVDTEGRVQMVRENFVEAEGQGLASGTEFAVYLFSEPILLGVGQTDPAGRFFASFPVDTEIPLGEHTLQIVGVTPTGEQRTVSMPVVVVEDREAAVSQAMPKSILVDQNPVEAWFESINYLLALLLVLIMVSLWVLFGSWRRRNNNNDFA